MDEIAAEAVTEARTILAAIEEGSTPISRIALRARRLAETIDNEEGRLWLRLECEGATSVPNLQRLGVPKDREASARAARKFHQLRAATDWNSISLNEFATAARQGKPLNKTWVLAGPLASLESPSPVELSSNLKQRDEDLEKLLRRDPLYMIDEIANRGDRQWAEMKTHLSRMEQQQVLTRVTAAIHDWASGVYLTHRFRQKADDIFNAFKGRAEAMLAALCPEAVRRLNHAVERLSPSSGAEEWSAAAMSCRRVLKDLADALHPPSTEPFEGRRVDDQAYKNRLWAFAKKYARAGQGIEEEIDYLCMVLDRLYELSNKGVHQDVSKEEAELCVLRTYVLAALLGKMWAGTPSRKGQ
jgi:AbiTii